MSDGHEDPGTRVVSIQLDSEGFPRKVLFACFGIELLLYALDYHFNYGRVIDISVFRRIFSSTIETSLPSFFSAGQTLLVALTLWLILRVEVARGTRRRVLVGWLLLAGFFTYMAVDDGAALHERIGTFLGILRDAAGRTTNFPSYNWQYFLMPFFGGMGFFVFGFLWFQMRDSASRMLVLTALGMLVCGIGIDFVEGLDDGHPWNLYSLFGELPAVDRWAEDRFGRSGFRVVRHFAKSAEELIFEAGAFSIFLFLFLRHLLRLSRDELHLRIRGRSPSA